MTQAVNRILLSTGIVIIFTGMTLAQWTYLGMGDRSCTKIIFQGQAMYVGTNDGIFRKEISATDTTWQQLGPSGSHINDFLLFGEDTILAATVTGIPGENPSIYLTVDGGSSWEPYQDDFGETFPLVCEALAHDPDSPDTLYARAGMTVARSIDRGNSWEPVYQDWDAIGYQSFLFNVNSETGVIWAGGENAIFQPYLLKSADHGMNWQYIGIDAGGDNACYSMVIHPGFPDSILVGMEGLIIRSGDGGNSWEQVFAAPSYPYIISMVSSPSSPEMIYASGTYNGTLGGPLFFYNSPDFGSSWDTVFYRPGEEGYYVNGLEIIQAENRDELYFATSHGVYRYVYSRVGIPGIKYPQISCSVFPNPSGNHFTLSVQNPEPVYHTLVIVNSAGQVVRKIRNIPSGKTEIHRGNLPDGIYYFKVMSEEGWEGSGRILFTR